MTIELQLNSDVTPKDSSEGKFSQWAKFVQVAWSELTEVYIYRLLREVANSLIGWLGIWKKQDCKMGDKKSAEEEHLELTH